MRHPVLTPFGLRPHSVSTGNYTKTLSLSVVQQMGYCQFRVNVHIDNEAYGLQAEQFKRRVESVCSDESLPVSRDPIGESDRRPILYVHINAIPIEMGDNEIGFACSTTVAFKQYLDGRYSDCMVGTYSQPIVFVGGNGDLEMAQYNYHAVKLLVQNFAKVWRECHKE